MIDLTAQTFGTLTVLHRGPNKGAAAAWVCRCECGSVNTYNGQNLRSGATKSCGCRRAETIGHARRSDLIGRTFGDLTVTELVGNRWRCRCACGGSNDVPTERLTSGKTTSCGCRLRQVTRERCTADIVGQTFNRLTVIERVGSAWRCSCSCGGETVTTTDKLRRGHTTSCGCNAATRRTGPEHASWDSSITPEERAVRAHRWRTREIVKWRRGVYARDGFTCVKCGKTNCALNAHHLDGFDWCIDKRYAVDNGATLCRACHRDYHTAHGQRRAVAVDFRTFLASADPTPLFS